MPRLILLIHSRKVSLEILIRASLQVSKAFVSRIIQPIRSYQGSEREHMVVSSEVVQWKPIFHLFHYSMHFFLLQLTVILSLLAGFV